MLFSLARQAGMSRLADLTGLDTVGIPVYSAIRPFGRSLSSAQGKGVTTDLAMLSALGETVEVCNPLTSKNTIPLLLKSPVW